MLSLPGYFTVIPFVERRHGHTIGTSGNHSITHFSTDLSSVDAESFPETVFHNVSG